MLFHDLEDEEEGFFFDPGFDFQQMGRNGGDASLIPMIPMIPMIPLPPSNFPSITGFNNNIFKAPAFANSTSLIPIDSLFKAAKLLESGNTISAHRILARLNHQLHSPSGKPFLRTAFYFMEALFAISSGSSEQCIFPLGSPLDVLLKLSAYKAFAEISPVLLFTSFTFTQIILEELAGANAIHVIDFDVGVGSHWPALIQELSERRSAVTGAPLQLRITAFVSVASHHQVELHLIHENLNRFAADLNVPFELNFLPFESFDPASIICSVSPSDVAIAVNFSFGFCHHHLSTQAFVFLIKQLSPKILISVNLGYDRGDISFSQHVLHSFQSTTVLLESIEASGVSPEITDRIERYMLRPRIENSLLGRYKTGEKLLPWRTIFTSAGFVPLQFSNFAEIQADCLLKKAQVGGFEVEKREAALMLSWKQQEIAVVSAWRC